MSVFLWISNKTAFGESDVLFEQKRNHFCSYSYEKKNVLEMIWEKIGFVIKIIISFYLST